MGRASTRDNESMSHATKMRYQDHNLIMVNAPTIYIYITPNSKELHNMTYSIKDLH